MIREKEKYISSGLMLLDYFSIIAGYLLLAYISILLNDSGLSDTLSYTPASLSSSFATACEKNEPLLLLLLLLPIIGLKLSSSYHLSRISDFKGILKETFKPVLIMSAILFLTLGYISKGFQLQFSAAVSLAFIWALFIINRIGLIKRLKNKRNDSKWLTHVLILGTSQTAVKTAQILSAHPEWQIHVIGFLSESENQGSEIESGHKVLGKVDDIAEVLRKGVVDCVFFAGGTDDMPRVHNIALLCGIMGIDFVVNLYPFKEKNTLFLEEYDLLSLLVFKSPYHSPEKLFIKRAMDIAVSLVIIIALLPLWIIIPLIIRLDSPGPPYFSQVRVGRNGRLFRLFKFRSMVADAEKLQAVLLSLNEMDGPVFKLTNDPRITRIGRFLRKTSLDELPQLFNVLMGDMSLVGPRPPLPDEVLQYGQAQRKRLSIKPGITCLWQISGRNEIKFDEWTRLDLQYIDHWSLFLDLKILFKTIFVVLSRKGAR